MPCRNKVCGLVLFQTCKPMIRSHITSTKILHAMATTNHPRPQRGLLTPALVEKKTPWCCAAAPLTPQAAGATSPLPADSNSAQQQQQQCHCCDNTLRIFVAILLSHVPCWLRLIVMPWQQANVTTLLTTGAGAYNSKQKCQLCAPEYGQPQHQWSNTPAGPASFICTRGC